MRLDSNIQWQKVADTWHLSYGEDHLVSIGRQQKGIRPFQIENKVFSISKKSGFSTTWQIRDQYHREVLALKFGFWNSKGKALFAGGSTYEIQYKTLPSFSLNFTDKINGEKLITYQIEKHKSDHVHPKLILYKKEMFTEQLLLLLGLGMVLFLDLYDHEFDFTTFILLTTA